MFFSNAEPTAVERSPAEAAAAAADALIDEGRFEEAAAKYREALSTQRLDPSLYHRLGYALHQSGDLDGAVLMYDRALTLVPDDPDVLVSLALVPICGSEAGGL